MDNLWAYENAGVVTGERDMQKDYTVRAKGRKSKSGEDLSSVSLEDGGGFYFKSNGEPLKKVKHLNTEITE